MLVNRLLNFLIAVESRDSLLKSQEITLLESENGLHLQLNKVHNAVEDLVISHTSATNTTLNLHNGCGRF